MISPVTAKKMLTKHKGNWGLGPSLRGAGEGSTFGHGGKNAGFSNNMTAHLPKGNGIIVLTSGDNDEEIINALEKAISNEYKMRLSDSKKVEVINLCNEELQKFIASYQMGDNKNMVTVAKVKKDKLAIRTGSDHELEAIGPLTFVDL